MQLKFTPLARRDTVLIVGILHGAMDAAAHIDTQFSD
jgi:hypothetical protein